MEASVNRTKIGFSFECNKNNKEDYSGQDEKSEGQWSIIDQNLQLSTVNKIRQVVDQIDMSQIPPNKEFISIAIGDPTKFQIVYYHHKLEDKSEPK